MSLVAGFITVVSIIGLIFVARVGVHGLLPGISLIALVIGVGLILWPQNVIHFFDFETFQWFWLVFALIIALILFWALQRFYHFEKLSYRVLLLTGAVMWCLGDSLLLFLMPTSRLTKGLTVGLIFYVGLAIADFLSTLWIVWWPKKQAVKSIIVLGSELTKDDQVSKDQAQRLKKGAQIWRQYPSAQIYVSGGQVRRNIPQSQAMAQYLVELGIPAEKITQENRSQSTWQNFAFTKQLLVNQTGVEVVTSNFHILRALMDARKQHMTVQGAAAPSSIKRLPYNFLRDFLGVLLLERKLIWSITAVVVLGVMLI